MYIVPNILSWISKTHYTLCVTEDTWRCSRFQNWQNVGKSGKLFETVQQKCYRDVLRVSSTQYCTCYC